MCPLSQMFTWWGDRELSTSKLRGPSFPSIRGHGSLTPWAPGLTILEPSPLFGTEVLVSRLYSGSSFCLSERLSTFRIIKIQSVKWTDCSSSAHSHLSATQEWNTVWNKGLKWEIFLRKNPLNNEYNVLLHLCHILSVTTKTRENWSYIYLRLKILLQKESCWRCLGL